MKSRKHTKTFEMAVPVAALFPLFSPEGEKRWVPGWDYENVMGSTLLCEDYVFLTKTHDHRGGDAIWIVKRYDPDVCVVELYKIEPDVKVGVVKVACTELGAERTEVEATYTYTALSEAGEDFISAFDEDAYDTFIGEWQTLLSAYFSGNETF